MYKAYRRAGWAPLLLAASLTIAACDRGGDGDARGAIVGAEPASALFAGVPQHGAALGDPGAPITLTELSDLQCPHCADFALHALPVIVEREVRAGRVRVVFCNLPVLGDDSDRAARMAAAAGLQDRMWPFVEVFFHNQGEEGSGYVTDDFLRRVGAAVPGLDVERALRERRSRAVDSLLDHCAVLARAHGIAATPSYLLRRAGAPEAQLQVRKNGDGDAFASAIEDMVRAGE